MKGKVLIILLSIISFSAYSQITFEKGYYINNDNQKINGLIKNLDWRNNPTEIVFKTSENSEVQNLTIESIKEFSINNISKYVKSTVDIDKSSDNLENLSKNKRAILEKETLFLKVLVEGETTLYQYLNKNLKRYFYSKNNSKIELLIYKTYKVGSRLAENNRFKQQIWKDLKCSSFKLNKIEKLKYEQKELIDYFIEYNNCNNSSPAINYNEKVKRDLFNLNIRPRVNYSSLITKFSSNNSNNDVDFGGKLGFGFGLEVEFILPFNKNKWAIAIEPTYQSFENEVSNDSNSVSGGKIITNVDYSSVELPVSLRHYFFLNENSKIYVNASIIFDNSSGSTITSKRQDNSTINTPLEIKSNLNYGLGFGYKFKDKYIMELRYQSNRDLLSNYTARSTEYKTLSFILGYSLF
ncbi:outer membrane beta-barrel protein [Polaribacter sp. KT 15]|uniref:outer membrane beta-barrel protein n=1 Tax=Polaribacter sp. KT 15 TaxID=1896175 RepID=UPI00090A532F|nr:outer membrane beta-barrel protein [Polaribacter sp. KT 15]SHN05564.1 Outer membrane protein beta-barrel domain-containing protein [Polaribacter sp. KT 15]